MRFFIDTANIEEIKQAASLGVLDGVTTNPSLVSREKGKFEDILRQICEIVDGPISAEVTAVDYDGMLREGRALAKMHKNIVVKCPCTRAGLQATKTFAEEGTGVNMTLVFSPTQAIMAANAGARFVSPFIGRLDDISTDGMQLIHQIVKIYGNYSFETEVLVASVRHPMHVVEAAMLGADICTMPFAVIDRLIQHPLTDLGLKKFLEDWEKVKGR